MICTGQLSNYLFNPAHELKRTENVLNGSEMRNIKNPLTDGYERDRSLRSEILKRN